MRSKSLETLSIFELVAMYEKASMLYGEAHDTGKPRITAQQADILRKLDKELWRRGQQGRAATLKLMSNGSPWVRLVAAGSALRFAPQEAERILQEIVPLQGDCGFQANLTLQQWRDGNISFED